MKILNYFDPRRVVGLTRKEVAVLRNDRFAMVIIFLIPTVIIITSSLGNAMIREAPRFGLLDADNSEGTIGIDLSQKFVELAVEYHNREEIVLTISKNETYLDYLLLNGRLEAIFLIPNGFEYNVSVGFPAIIEVKVDSLNILTFQFTNDKVDELVSDFREQYDINGIFNKEIINYLRPEKASRLFDIAPFFFPWTLFSIGCLIASQVIVSDIPKHRMALTPTNKFEISISKIGGIQFLITLLCIELIILSFVFGFESRGSIWIYFFVIWIISLSGVTLGFMLSAFAKTPLAALQFYLFFFLLQVIAIFFIPWEAILYIFPVYNGEFMMLASVIRGQPLETVGFYVNNVVLFTLGTFLVGFLKYRRLPTLV